MDKSTVLKIIEHFKTALEKQSIHVNKIILYGSYAIGNFHEGSDIDLVVISDDFSGKGFWERIEILSEAVFEVFAPIEAVAMSSSEWDNKESMIAHYAATGEIVYAA